MDIMFFGLMAVIMVFIIYKNLSLFKRMKHNNQYIECYKAMLNNDEGAYELIKNTIENEPLSEFRHKLKIFQLFCEVNNDNNCLASKDFIKFINNESLSSLNIIIYSCNIFSKKS